VSWKFSHLKELAQEAEHYETDPWAARAILRHETMIGQVVDPCCGRGILAASARAAGYNVVYFDKYADVWGAGQKIDFLVDPRVPGLVAGNTVFMNPPFSLACEFVERAIDCGAEKIVSFQRFAWWEAGKRREFWDRHPPVRVYVCGDRAACWRADIAPADRKGNPPTAHAWFVWEKDHSGETVLGRLYKHEQIESLAA